MTKSKLDNPTMFENLKTVDKRRMWFSFAVGVFTGLLIAALTL